MPIKTKETPLICNKETVLKAFSALKKLDGSLENVKKPLLEESCEQFIYLQVSMKKIPKQKETVQILLPHSIIKKTAEICIFTGDLEKKKKKAEIEPTVLHYKELLKSKNVVQVNEVVPLRQLRTEYKTFESRRQLASAYDIFLTDKKIAQCLPNLLGKAFYTKNKFPLQVDLEINDLKPHIEKALSKTSFILNGHGNTCSFKVARLDMDAKKTLENIEMCIQGLSSKIPGGTDNFSGLYLKTAKSKAIPIYISLEIPNAVHLDRKRKREEVFEDELSTFPNAKVKVFKSGKIEITKTADDMKDESAEESSDNLKEVKARGKREDTIEGDDAGSSDEAFSDDDIDNLIASEKTKTRHLLKVSKKKNKKKTVFLAKNSPKKKSKEMKTVEDVNKGIPTKKKLQKMFMKKESIKDEVSVVNSDKENSNTLSTVTSSKKTKQPKKIQQHPVSDTVVRKQETEVVTKSIGKKKAKKSKSPVRKSDGISKSPVFVEPKKKKRRKNTEVISNDASQIESSPSNSTKKLSKKEKKIKTPKSEVSIPTPQKSKSKRLKV